MSSNTFEHLVNHWINLVEIASQQDAHDQLARYVERNVFAPLADDGIGQLGYKLVTLVTGGFLAQNSNPLDWKVESSIQFADELTLDEGKAQSITGTKRVKVQNHTARNLMRNIARTLANATKAPSKSHLENETNRRFKVALAQLPESVKLSKAQETEMRSVIARQVNDDLSPSHDAHVTSISRLAFVVSLYYRYSPDFTASEVREILPYHDGFWADQVIGKNIRLSVRDNAPTIAQHVERVLAKQQKPEVVNA